MVHLNGALAAAAVLVAATSAQAADASRVVKRQSSAAATGAASAPPAAYTSFTGSLPASVLSIVTTITSGTPSVFPTYTTPTTATPGQTNTYVSGAPPLPTASSLRPADYPALDVVPPTDSAQVQSWLSQIDFSKVPSAPTNGAADCSNQTSSNYQNRGSNGVCWWTCGGCTRDTDITTCEDQNTWGASWDDGPSPYTPRLLTYLQQQDIKATFFVVGSRAISRPDLLQSTYVSGHQIAVHTWSHHALTTLTNEQIVAELGWSKKVIHDALGVTPNVMRPPYGDIDDRVRAISLQMGLRPIIWTTANGQTYDTNDWKIGAGVVSAANSAYTFEQIIRNGPSLNTGYIVLAHDLYQQSVELSVEVILPFVQQFTPKQTLKPIVQCIGRTNADAYVETANNQTVQPSGSFASSVGASTPGSTSTRTGSGAGSTSGSSNAASSSSGSGRNAAESLVGRVELASLLMVTLAAGASFILL